MTGGLLIRELKLLESVLLLRGDRVPVMSARAGYILEVISLFFPRRRERDLVVEFDFFTVKRRCLDLLRPRDGKPPMPRLTPLGLPLPVTA